MRKVCALALLLGSLAIHSPVRADPVIMPEAQKPAERQYWWQWWRPARKPATERITAPPQPPACPFVLQVEEQAEQIRLIVPRNLMKDLKVAELPTETPVAGLARPQGTILAGVFLTLALASGGLWIAKRGVPGVRTVAVGAGLMLLLGGTLARADMPWGHTPNPAFDAMGQARRMAAEMKSQQLEELKKLPQIAVEVIEQGDRIRLVVGREKLAKLVEQAAPKHNP
jgi:hypothetical protein